MDENVTLGEVYRVALRIERRLEGKVSLDVYEVERRALADRVEALEEVEAARSTENRSWGRAWLAPLAAAVAGGLLGHVKVH